MEEKKKRGFYLPGVKAVCTVILLLALTAVFVFGNILMSAVRLSNAVFYDLYKGRSFEKSETCGQLMAQEMLRISEGWNKAKYFEKDGKRDMDALVDIQNFRGGIQEEDKINKNTAYSLKNLEAMAVRDYSDIQFFLRDRLEMSRNMGYEVSDEMPTRFSPMFSFLYSEGKSLEKILPESGVSLADYALQNPDTVSLYTLYQQLLEVLAEYESYFYGRERQKGESNLCYWIYDGDSGRTFSHGFDKNLQPEAAKIIAQKLREEETAPVLWKDSNGWGMVPDNNLQGEATTGRGLADSENACFTVLKEWFKNHSFCDGNEMVLLTLDAGFTEDDVLQESHSAYEKFAPMFWPSLAGLGISLLLALIFLILVTVQAGHSAGGEKLHLTKLDMLPTEPVFAAMLTIGVMCAEGLLWALRRYMTPDIIIVQGLAAAAAAGILLSLYLSIVRRVKAHNLWERSILRFIVKTGRSIYEARRTSGKLIILFTMFALMHIFLIGAFRGGGILLCIIMDVLCVCFLLKETFGRQIIKDGLQQITDGNLDYKINLEGLKGDNLQMAESINGLGNGLMAAVEKSMKSERLKADLITNVSHDIKTPLTSIINYVDFLKRENIQDAKIRGYIDVLDSKSQRLKQLTEDLVEASKISSGNVKLEFGRMNLKELICQTNGEFAERFAKRELELICRIADEPLLVYADGRRMWRILENLYVNTAKYAMPKTRVYVDAWVENGNVFFTIKNISEHTLNINAEELTERFIRGDISRSTEGSGLGLSIAKNLTQLQKGSFEIYLDGDLFKVTICFPQITGK